MTNTATNTPTLTRGMTIQLPGRKRPLTVSHVVDLAQYPGTSKYITASYGLTGSRNANYKLDRRTDGRWFLIGMGRSNKVDWFVDSDIEIVN